MSNPTKIMIICTEVKQRSAEFAAMQQIATGQDRPNRAADRFHQSAEELELDRQSRSLVEISRIDWSFNCFVAVLLLKTLKPQKRHC